MQGNFSIKVYENTKVVEKTIVGSVVGNRFGVHRPVNKSRQWKITHLASGMGLPGEIRLLSQALACATALSEIDGADQEYPSQAVRTSMRIIFTQFSE